MNSVYDHDQLYAQLQPLQYTRIVVAVFHKSQLQNWIIMPFSILGSVITLFCLTQNYQEKCWRISEPQIFPWSKMKVELNLWAKLSKYSTYLLKGTESPALVALWTDLKPLKRRTKTFFICIQCSENLLCYNHDVIIAWFTSKKNPTWKYLWNISSAKCFALHLNNAYHVVQYVALYLIAAILFKNTSIRETHGIVITNLCTLTFSRKTSANILKLDAWK